MLQLVQSWFYSFIKKTVKLNEQRVALHLLLVLVNKESGPVAAVPSMMTSRKAARKMCVSAEVIAGLLTQPNGVLFPWRCGRVKSRAFNIVYVYFSRYYSAIEGRQIKTTKTKGLTYASRVVPAYTNVGLGSLGQNVHKLWFNSVGRTSDWFGLLCPRQRLKYICSAIQTDLPFLFPRKGCLFMYTKSSLKWKQYAINVVTGDLFQNYIIAPSQKLIQMQVLMNRLYLLIQKELQLNKPGFSQDHHKNIDPLDNFSSTGIPGQSTVASGTL